jgi:hypothetical protein
LRYSPETGAFWIHVNGATGDASHSAISIVGPTVVVGVRKVKNVKIDMISDSNVPVFWAVLYIPEGLDPNPGLLIGNMG